MNKKILLLLIPSLVLANSTNNVFEYSDDKINMEYNDNIETLEKEKLKVKLLDFNNINITSSIDYANNSNVLVQNNSLTFGFVHYDLGFNVLDKKITSHKVYASKTINEFLYDKFSEGQLDAELKKLEFIKTREEKIDKNLDLYKSYILKKATVDLYQKESVKYTKDLEILEKSYKIGTISQHDYNVSKKKIELAEAGYILEKSDLENMLIQFKASDIENYEKFEFKYDKSSNLTKEEIEKYVDNTFTKSEKLYIAKAKISKSKDLVMNTIPKITPNVGYDILNKSFNVGISVSKDFEIIKTDTTLNENLKLAKEKEDKLDLNVQKMVNEYVSKYNRLKYNYTSNLVNISNLEEELVINNKKYEIGTLSYAKVLETRTNLLKAKKELEESKIDLLLFIAKIKRGGM